MDKKLELRQTNLLLVVMITEGLLFLFALLCSFFTKINPFNSIYFDFKDIILGIFGGIILLAVNFLAINVFSKYISFFKSLKEAYNTVSVLAANVTLPGAFLMAILSGFAEEFFFRGVLQVQFGIIISSIIFGLFHIGGKKTFCYGIYAILTGFYLGGLYILTGNLLVPMIVHFLNNFLAFPYMRYYYNKYIRKDLI